MSGIAGVLSAHPCKEDLNRYLSVLRGALRHRGPDGILMETGDNWGLLHFSLRTTINPGQQPFTDAAGATITSDARLDDIDGLRKKLGADPTTSESELILMAYRKWGENCVDYLDGDFAFVIHDQQKLFCVRDHFGVKPLYIGERNGLFVFASEADAVARVLEADLDENRIADFLLFPLEHVDAVSTFYRDVERLTPATCLLVSSKGINLRTYWEVDAQRSIVMSHDAEYVEGFRELLMGSVKDRLQGEGPVASTLSGGIDSSTIVGCTRLLAGDRGVTTFSTIFPNTNDHDTQYIDTVVRELGLNAVRICPGEIERHADRLLDAVECMGEPFDNYMVQIMLIDLVAHDSGHKFLLDGVEGDLLHSLSASYPSTMLRDGEVRDGLKEIYHQWTNVYERQVPLPLLYLRAFRNIGAPDWLKSLKASVMGKRHFAAMLATTAINEEFAQRTQVRERLDEMSARIYGARRGIREQHLRAIRHPAIPVALERYDRVASRHGVEPRHPLVDKDLVEFSYAIPCNLKVRGGWSKYLLRRSGDGIIPESVSFRTNGDENGWRYHDLFVESCESRLRELISSNRQRLSEYIRPDFLVRCPREHLLEIYGLAVWLNRVDRERDETRIQINETH